MKLTLAAGVVAVVVLAAGCSEDPEPKFEAPSETPSASTQSTPTSPSSTSPPQTATPLETVREWITANNAALETGDTKAMLAVSAQECRGCLNYVEPIERVYGAGGSFDTTGWQILESRVTTSTESSATIDAAVRIAPGRTVAAAGEAASPYPAERRLMSFELVLKDGRWLINLIAVIR